MRIVLCGKTERRRENSVVNVTNELFFDLVFAACISTLNYDLANDRYGLGERVLHYALLYQPFWWSYYSIVVYINRFTTEDMFHHVFMLLQAIMSIGMATNVVWCETEKGANNTKVVVCTNAIESYSPDFDSFRSFTLYSAGLQLAIAGLYTTAILRVPEAKRFAAVHVATRILAGITWILLGLVHPATAAVVPGAGNGSIHNGTFPPNGSLPNGSVPNGSSSSSSRALAFAAGAGGAGATGATAADREPLSLLGWPERELLLVGSHKKHHGHHGGNSSSHKLPTGAGPGELLGDAAYTGRLVGVFFISFMHIGAEVLTTSSRRWRLDSLLPDHAGARMRKFMIVVLGQSLAGLIQPQATYNSKAMVTAVALIVLAFGFKLLYFDMDVGWKTSILHHTPRAGVPLVRRIRRVFWVLGHMILAMSFTALGSSSKSVITALNDYAIEMVATERRLRDLVCGSVACSFAASITIQLAIPGAGSKVRQWRKRWRVGARTVTAIAAMCFR